MEPWGTLGHMGLGGHLDTEGTWDTWGHGIWGCLDVVGTAGARGDMGDVEGTYGSGATWGDIGTYGTGGTWGVLVEGGLQEVLGLFGEACGGA